MNYLYAVLLGVPMTLGVTVSAFALGAVLALPVLAAMRSGNAAVRFLARAVVDIVRGIPVLVWLFIIYFGISIGAFKFGSLSGAIVGLGLVSSAYLAEVYRGALSSVHRGQWEASAALALSKRTTFTRIIGPQAVRVALPSATTYAIGLLKDSSIASAIGVTEIVFRTTQEARVAGGGLTAFMIAAVVYIALSVPLAWLSRTLDGRMRAVVAR